MVVQARLSIFEPREARTIFRLQVQPTGEQHHGGQEHQEDRPLIQVTIRPHPDGVPPVIDTGVGDVDRVRRPGLREGINGALTELGVPNRVSDGTDVEGIFDPLLEVALPSDMEEVA